jgi:hypothetical protein
MDEYKVDSDYFLITHIRHNRAYALHKSDHDRFRDAEGDELFVCFSFRNGKLELPVPIYYSRAELDHYAAA